ncbi:hypothetical protein ACLOJK_032420 [Asimina triloba]
MTGSRRYNCQSISRHIVQTKAQISLAGGAAQRGGPLSQRIGSPQQRSSNLRMQHLPRQKPARKAAMDGRNHPIISLCAVHSYEVVVDAASPLGGGGGGGQPTYRTITRLCAAAATCLWFHSGKLQTTWDPPSILWAPRCSQGKPPRWRGERRSRIFFNETPLSLSLSILLPCLGSTVTMTDTTDDIAEEISFQSFDDDCKLLGSLLNDVLQREVGPQFMEKVERKRILAQSFSSSISSLSLILSVNAFFFSCGFLLRLRSMERSSSRCISDVTFLALIGEFLKSKWAGLGSNWNVMPTSRDVPSILADDAPRQIILGRILTACVPPNL